MIYLLFAKNPTIEEIGKEIIMVDIPAILIILIISLHGSC